jgi:hypothetical protein
MHRHTAFFLCWLLVSAGAAAGELTLTWPTAEDDLTVGYRVYVGVEPGVYERSVDAAEEARVTIRDLADDVEHYFAVKAYDAEGKESPSYSPEVASLPSPRIDAIEPAALESGSAAFVALRGANFSSDVQVRVLDERLSLRSAAAVGPGQVVLYLEARPAPEGEASESIALDPAGFLLVNPGRKADEYFEAHPEVVDLDWSGWVDESDLDRVRVALGTRAGEDGYRVEADVDGDGVVALADLARLTARLGTPARFRPPVAEEAEVEQTPGDTLEPKAD